MGGMNCKMISVMNSVQEEENTEKTTKTNQAYIKYIEMLQNGKVSKILECQYPNKQSMIDGQIK